MASFRQSSCSQPSHLEALCRKHTTLERQIKDAQNHPSTTDDELRQLKMKRLHLREEIELRQGQQGA